MNTATKPPPQPLSTIDKSIVALHAIVAAALGIYGFFDVDPDWAGLQRIAIMMMIGLWAGGIAASAIIARMVRAQWIRVLILLAVPFVGIAVLVAQTALG